MAERKHTLAVSADSRMWKPGDVVLVGNELHFIVRKNSITPDAWEVNTRPLTRHGGTGTHIVQEGYMELPIPGLNVCLAPKGLHACPLAHVLKQDLEWLIGDILKQTGLNVIPAFGLDDTGEPVLYF